MKMILSGISTKQQKPGEANAGAGADKVGDAERAQKIAHVRFEDGDRYAEGSIPSCIITVNRGFTIEEVLQMQDYLDENLEDLKRQAAGLSPFRAMMRDDSGV